MSGHGTPEEKILELILPMIERGIDTSVEHTLTKQRSMTIMPGIIHQVNGLFADVEPDDTPGEYLQAIRLDHFQGVDGGIIGKRARTLLLRVPPAGIYCLGALPDPRVEEEQAEDIGMFYSEASDSARAAGALTDMSVTTDLTGGYLYRVSVNSLISFGLLDAGIYALDVDQDGTTVGNIDKYADPHDQLGLNGWVDIRVRDDIESSVLTVFNSAGSSSSITLAGSATRPRTMVVECVGPLRSMPSS